MKAAIESRSVVDRGAGEFHDSLGWGAEAGNAVEVVGEYMQRA